MNPMYVSARIPQIDRMLRRLTEAREAEDQHYLRNLLSGRHLGERGTIFAWRRRNEIRNDIEKLTDERKTLED